MRFLHLADLHLGWSPVFLGDREDERRRERDGLLARAVNFALDRAHGIDLVLIAGDLFENHRPEKALAERALGELQRLVAAGVQLVTLPGNHDEITYHDSIYRQMARDWPGILVQNPLPEPVGDFSIHGERCIVYSLAYTGGITPTASYLADFPRLEGEGWHLGLFHGSLDWNAGDRSLPLSSEGLARARYHYVALGHLHGHKVVQLPSGPAVYSGAVEGKGFSDPGEGMFTVVTLGREGTLIERVKAMVRPVRSEYLDVGLFNTSGELGERLEALGDPEAMVRVVLTGVANFAIGAESLAAKWGHLFYHLGIEDETKALAPELLEPWSRELTIRGLFVRRLQAKLAEARDDRERQVIARALLNGLVSLGVTEKT